MTRGRGLGIRPDFGVPLACLLTSSRHSPSESFRRSTMTRHVLAFAVAVCVAPVAAAQSTVLTITAARADVRKAPTGASPVVGQAPQGSVLEVTREVGDWVKVSWPDGPDGIGYVRLAGGGLSKTPGPGAHAGATGPAA